MSAFFSSAVRECFRGWSTVAVYEKPQAFDDLLHVHLTLDKRALAVRAIDKSEVAERLFRRSDAWHAVQLVEKARKNTGLFRYGRKRR